MLEIVPITQKEANAFVAKHHRHHKPVVGSVFQVAVAKGDEVVGVAIVGRPVSRMLDDGWTLEVNRLCTTGEKNACSMLYAASWRAAKALGYKRLITYILNTEPGTSLVAAGWKCLGEAGGGSWNVKSRPRVDHHPTQKKLLFEAQ
jgi:tRNA A37 N6-isopentenylltransferase MiaA